jgi:hypothetical protein
MDARGRALALVAAGVTVAAVGAVLAQLLVVFVGVVAAGAGTARLITAVRADPGTREQEKLILALWSMGRRWPDGEGRIDPVTGQVLAIERHSGFLTLVVATPPVDAPESGGSAGHDPGDPTTVTRYLLGLLTLPAPPPLIRDVEPFDQVGEERGLTRRQAKELLAFNDQTGAMEASTAELAELQEQMMRAWPATPEGDPGG